MKPAIKLSSYHGRRTKQEWKLIVNNPFGDKDKDGVKNIFDCRPLNKKKQGIYHLPQTKKSHYRNPFNIPIIIRHGGDRQVLEVLGRKGGTVYFKDSEEKLADLQKQYPLTSDFDGYTKESILEMEKGNSKRILAKGKTPGKIILQQTAWKSVPEYKNKWGGKEYEKKIGQITIFNTETGDTEKFKEHSKFTKKEIEKERADDADMKEYHPLSEKFFIEETDSNAEVLNESPETLIKRKREKLRDEARESRLNPEYDYKYGFTDEEEKTANALVNVADYETDEEED